MPPLPDKGPPIPEYLLKQYPWLRGSPLEIWGHLWPFPNLPPRLKEKGISRYYYSKAEEVDRSPLSYELKLLKWTQFVLEDYHNGLLTEGEKDELLKWSFER